MYTQNPQTFRFNFNSADFVTVVADDADLFSIIVPANREVQIQSFRAAVRTEFDVTADLSMELVKEDNTVLAQVLLDAAGEISAVNAAGSAPASFPMTVAPQSTTALSVLKLKFNGDIDDTAGTPNEACDATLEVTIAGLL